MTDRERELEALIAEGAVYLIVVVNALHRLGLDMRGETKPFIADVETVLHRPIPTGWPDP